MVVFVIRSLVGLTTSPGTPRSVDGLLMAYAAYAQRFMLGFERILGSGGSGSTPVWP